MRAAFVGILVISSVLFSNSAAFVLRGPLVARLLRSVNLPSTSAVFYSE